MKAFGVGMGMIAVGTLTGCTSDLISKKAFENHQSKMAALSKEDRLAQAFAKLNKKLLKKAADEMKAVSKAYKRQTITARAVVLKTRKVAEQVFDHYNKIGLTSALEENAHAALQAYAGLEPEVISYLRSAELTEDEIQELQALCQKVRNELLARASSLHLSRMMSNIIAQLNMIESYQASSTVAPQGLLKFLACAGSIAVTLGTAIATAGACVGCAQNPNLAGCAGCVGGVIATVGMVAVTVAACAG